MTYFLTTVLRHHEKLHALKIALAVLAMGFAPIAMAQSSASAVGNRLVGAWKVQVTLRDCATNAQLGPPFASLVSFHRGGTLAESAGRTAFENGQRTDAHGFWEHRVGKHYVQKMLNLIRFDSAANLPNVPGFDPSKPLSPGFQAGTQIISQDVQMMDRDRFTSTGGNEFYTTAGVLYRTGCSSASGERVQ